MPRFRLKRDVQEVTIKAPSELSARILAAGVTNPDLVLGARALWRQSIAGTRPPDVAENALLLFNTEADFLDPLTSSCELIESYWSVQQYEPNQESNVFGLICAETEEEARQIANDDGWKKTAEIKEICLPDLGACEHIPS